MSGHSSQSELPAWPVARPRGLARTFGLAVITGAALALFSGWADAAEGANVIGAGVRNGPAYAGSDVEHTSVVPVLSLATGPWFARSSHGILEGGARHVLADGFAIGLQAAHEDGPRDESAGASLGAHAEWRTSLGPAPVTALARYRSHLDAEHGREWDVRLAAGLYEGHGIRAGLHGQATWATRRHQQAYYGVAHSGLFFTSVGAFASCNVTRDVALVASAEARRLADAPAASGLVREQTSTYVNFGIAYRF